MIDNQRKPAIRYAEFNDAWEQRKLGDVIDLCSGKDYKHLSNGSIPVYGTGGYMLSVNEALSYDKDAIGIGRKGTIDNPYVLKAPFWTVDTLFFAIPKDNNDLDCVFAIFQNIDWRKKDESTGVPSLSKIAINQIDILMPVIEEQLQVGRCFKQLNNLITLHQREYDKALNIKKAMLEKMFPKNGEDRPEIRFKGFTDAWEQRKLSEVAEFSKGQGYKKADLKDSGTPIILYGYLYTNYQSEIQKVDTFSDIIPNAVISKGREVIVPASGETAEDIAVASAVEQSGILLGGGLNIIFPHEEIDSAFLSLMITYGPPHYELSKKAQGKSIVHLYNDDLKGILFLFPSIIEQQQISSLIKKLDNLITLHQRELKKLQNMKKALLEKMFVQG